MEQFDWAEYNRRKEQQQPVYEKDEPFIPLFYVVIGSDQQVV